MYQFKISRRQSSRVGKYFNNYIVSIFNIRVCNINIVNIFTCQGLSVQSKCALTNDIEVNRFLLIDKKLQ